MTAFAAGCSVAVSGGVAAAAGEVVVAGGGVVVAACGVAERLCGIVVGFVARLSTGFALSAAVGFCFGVTASFTSDAVDVTVRGALSEEEMISGGEMIVRTPESITKHENIRSAAERRSMKGLFCIPEWFTMSSSCTVA